MENQKIVYDLIASHGDIEDMVFFAVLMQGIKFFYFFLSVISIFCYMYFHIC